MDKPERVGAAPTLPALFTMDEVAGHLHISRRTLQYRLKKYGLTTR